MTKADEGAEADEPRRVVLIPRRWDQACCDASAHAGEGGKKARSPRRARYRLLTPSRRACRCAGCPVVPAACIFCCRRAMGAAEALGIPCALFFEGGSPLMTRTKPVARM